MSNAINYAGERAEIEFHTTLEAEICCITVTDNGKGIPAAHQQHLFKAFFRAHHTGTILGTGLGLHIVERNAALLGGRVELDSREGEGSRFTLLLPRFL